MRAVVAVLALLAGLLHLLIFRMESMVWSRPETWRRFGVASQQLADANQPVMYNQGFYNLFLGIGAITGAVCLVAGPTTVGWSLVVFTCACMLGAAVVLRTTGSRYTRAAVTQGTLPALALIAALVVVVS